jgi:ABC-2 type transport system permease protein
MYLALLAPFALYLPFLYYQARFHFDVGPVISLGVGLATMGMMFTAIGVFFSALTRNQVVAAIWTFVVLFMLIIMTLLVYFYAARQQTGWAEASRYVTVMYQVQNFGLGRVDMRTVALQLSVCVFVLYAATMIFAARRGR